jgi:DNA-binding NtrC family response regulator
MPALRERASDVAELAENFLGLVADREGGRRKRLSKDALALFERYGWPGNVRELQNLCERAAVLTAGDVIEGALVAPWIGGTGLPSSERAPAAPAALGGMGLPLSRPVPSSSPVVPVIETFSSAADALIGVASPSGSSQQVAHAASQSAGDGTGLPTLVCDGRLTLDEIERRSIVATLGRFRGHRQKSAKALGIGVRTLGLKLKKWKEESLVPAEL